MRNETEAETIEDAEPYIEMFETIRNRVGDDDIAVAVMHELSKDRRMAAIRAERQAKLEAFQPERPSYKPGTGSRPASKKQLDYLKDLGITPRVNMTSEDASQAIDEVQARRNAT